MGDCPSIFKLPALAPDSSIDPLLAKLPTHVYKAGQNGNTKDYNNNAYDHYQLGIWQDGPPGIAEFAGCGLSFGIGNYRSV